MGYKARLKASSDKLQRKAYPERLPATSAEYLTPIEEFDYTIGEFEKIVNLEDFHEIYFSQDTEHKHPIYKLHFAEADAPRIFKDLSTATKTVDLNGEKLTFFLMNDTVYNEVLDVNEVIGWGFTDGFNHSTINTEQTDPEDRIIPERFNICGYRNAERYYGRNVSGGSVWRVKDIFKKVFENGEVKLIDGKYNPEDDTVTVLMTEKELGRNWQYYNFYDDDDNRRMRIYNHNYNTAYPSNNIMFTGGYPYYGVDGDLGLIAPDNTLVNFYLPVPSGIGGADQVVLFGRTAGHATELKTLNTFLKDKNGEYWVYCITNLPGYDNKTFPYNITSSYYNIYVAKIKDLPIQICSTEGTANPPAWVDSTHFTDLMQIDELLDAVFKPEKDKEDEDYSDDGADIFGPGDKLEDITNIDDAVGGDSDMTDELEEDDAEPNTSVDSFRVTSGLFGAFKLTPALMQKYTGTLSQLYSRSNTLVLGTIYQNFADRMTKNTTGVIMLPFDIGADCLTSSIFAMGNSGVMNDLSDWVGYCAGTNFASAPLITKELTQFSVSLGTIRHYYDTFLDFAPYSTASLYLPYIGVVELPMNLVQSTSTETKNLSLLYRINNMTGDLVVILQVNGQTINHWTGNCARPIQVSVDDNSGVLREGLRALMSTVRAGANVAGGLQAGSMTSMLAQGDSFIPNPTTAPVSQHLIGNSAPTGSTGFMDSQNIVLIVERPIIYKPDDYGTLIGYPTKKIAKLGSVQGFARVTEAHIRCQATQEEREELERILSEGVQF